MTSTAPTQTPCPYCTTPLGGEPTSECEHCGARHHADCWAVNGGCAVALCIAGPKGSDPALRPPVPARPVLVVELDDEPDNGRAPDPPAVTLDVPARLAATARQADDGPRRVAVAVLAAVATVLCLLLLLVVRFA